TRDLLAKPGFADKAPKDVVEKEKKKLKEREDRMKLLEAEMRKRRGQEKAARRVGDAGWHARERVAQRRGLLSERPLDGGPSQSHRGRAKKTPALHPRSPGTGPASPLPNRSAGALTVPALRSVPA